MVTSDSENLHATGVELIHDADAHMTVLKGDAQQQMQAVKDGNLIRGSELHLFGDGKEISQAHVLGAGSVGMGELDPKTGEYQKQATWTDRFVFVRQAGEKDKPPVDVLTFLGKDGGKAMFRDTSSGQLQEIEAYQLRVGLKPPDPDKDDKDSKDAKDGKKVPPKKAEPRKAEPKKSGAKKDDPAGDVTKTAKPMWLEAIGEVRSTSPDIVIKHTDELNIWFEDVPQLLKPPAEPKTARSRPSRQRPRGRPTRRAALRPRKTRPRPTPPARRKSRRRRTWREEAARRLRPEDRDVGQPRPEGSATKSST